MEACYGGTDVLERPCAVARGSDINIQVLEVLCVSRIQCLLFIKVLLLT
jgi:hypothetical protein